MFSTGGLLLGLLCAISAPAWSQKSSLETMPAPRTSPASGKEMFAAYCATCHGETGKGNGPAAGALKVSPADLTTLAKRNAGKFPAERVQTVLEGRGGISAHGSSEMPVWGPIFLQMSRGRPGVVKQRIFNLTNYIASLQLK